MVSLFLLFNFTIGYQIRKIEDKVTNLSSKDKIEEIKIKLKKEIQSGLEKDKIFNEEERILLRDFLEKIVTELELNKINK
jgi:stage III sporulation protein SpoIIIAA